MAVVSDARKATFGENLAAGVYRLLRAALIPAVFVGFMAAIDAIKAPAADAENRETWLLCFVIGFPMACLIALVMSTYYYRNRRYCLACTIAIAPWAVAFAMAYVTSIGRTGLRR